MERELKLGNKIVVLDDRTGPLERSIDIRTGRPTLETSPVAYLIVVAWAWIFRRVLRRTRERKQRLDASIPPR